MQILWSWLREMVDIPESPEAFAERLTRAGLEVEGIKTYTRLSHHLREIYVGKIVSLEKHPNADRLQLAQVRLDSEKQVQIVTGATNIRVGVHVPVALPGSHVWIQGKWEKLEPRKLRGVLSEGMLCSGQELGLGGDAEGIFILSEEVPVGATLSQVLENYEDILLEIAATPNRGDALSHWGIAREYAALTGASLHAPSLSIQGERFLFPLTLEVPDLEACPRYGGLYLKGIEKGKKSPSWLHLRLEALGMRSLHPVVDITNYVLLGWGQPLHAFDAHNLRGHTLRISPLEVPAEMESLGGKVLALQPGDIVIADEAGAACLGGIVGGKRTAVSAETTEVFLESAYFSPAFIRRTARRLGLNTESSYRFMRGTDPHQVPTAALLAASLLQSLYPHLQVSHYHEVHSPAHTAPYHFPISLSDLQRRIGIPLARSSFHQRMQRLDIQVQMQSEDILALEVPRYRIDVQRPVDIAEEILRTEGWNSLPSACLSVALPSPTEHRYELREEIAEFLTGLGFYEIRTSSLGRMEVIPEPLRAQAVRLANPLYEEMAYLRVILLPSGLEVIAHNRAHGAQGFWAYEWGRVYSQVGEKVKLGLWGWGRPPWYELEKEAPLPYLLAAVRGLLLRTGVTFQEKQTSPKYPWQVKVDLFSRDMYIGTVGIPDPAYLRLFGLQGESVACAEIEEVFLDAALRRLPSYQEVHYTPIVIKDLSVYLPDGLTYADLQAAIEGLRYPLLQGMEPFDLYEDREGRRSYGLRFYLQGNHTLTDAEIHDFLEKAISALEATGAKVRRPDGG
ncbi:MAG: phenylalanine--tRNA ligase subunit beta [Bacteroidia bacterium]|nr:phenylalanine--tRNA ligase subunit beta [Bacteroidia bacterium]MDW8235597.1 phenylalanine--tRNA ligase subunit beta [Bacteroidia bacterium]